MEKYEVITLEREEVGVLIGGKAGEGISSAGQIVAQMLGHRGYRVHMYFDYPSLIKGGHNFAIIRGARYKIGAVRSSVDFLLAMNQETIDLHRGRLPPDGVVVYRSDTARHSEGIGVEVKDLLAREEAPVVMGNSAILGAFARAAGIEWALAEAVLRKSIPRQIEKNLRIARQAYDSSEIRLPIPPLYQTPLPVVTGNEAIALGLLKHGLRVYCGYPMSPTSNLLHFLASYAQKARVRVIQPESETAVILIALGCAYAGNRAAVGTSGGGFCLMTEAFGMAGIAELPILVVLGQRPGPSTGLATYTAQSDLQFALSAGQGDVPRLIVAPGDAEEAMTWAGACLDLSWKYQLPSILLADKTLCEGMYSMDRAEVGKFHIEPILAHEETHPYLRYAMTDSGISPLRFPPLKGEVIRVNSHVHDPDGITTEDEETTKGMADKRGKKMRSLKEELETMHPVQRGGDEDASSALLCWGSNKGICLELGKRFGLRVVRPVALWPFPTDSFTRAVEGVDRMFAVENNETGQLARLVSGFGYRCEKLILKYNGRPFMVDELEEELRSVIA